MSAGQLPNRVAWPSDTSLQTEVATQLRGEWQPPAGQLGRIRLHGREQGLVGAQESIVHDGATPELAHCFTRSPQILCQERQGPVSGLLCMGRVGGHWMTSVPSRSDALPVIAISNPTLAWAPPSASSAGSTNETDRKEPEATAEAMRRPQAGNGVASNRTRDSDLCSNVANPERGGGPWSAQSVPDIPVCPAYFGCGSCTCRGSAHRLRVLTLTRQVTPSIRIDLWLSPEKTTKPSSRVPAVWAGVGPAGAHAAATWPPGGTWA